MSNIEDGLLEILRDPGHSLWEQTWRTLLRMELSERACDLIDLTTPELPSVWDELDSTRHRGRLLPSNKLTWGACADHLLREANYLNDQLDAKGLAKLGKKVLRTKLLTVIPALTASPISGAVIAENPFPSLWQDIANELARRIHNRNYPSDIDAEWLLLNGLSLVGYFGTCQLPLAELVRQVLKEPRQKPMGLRGFFIRIPELVSPNGVDDTPVPTVAAQGAVSLHHASLSQLLDTTAAQSGRIAVGNGLLHEILQTTSESQVPRHLWGIVTPAQLRQGRDAAYRLYEHTILAYLSLACIEQLLRTWATNQSITHIRSSGRPIGVMSWLDQLNPTPDLKAALRDIYHTSGANIRNRVMHGNLLEIEGKSLDTRLPIADSRRFSMPNVDPYMPENISSVCMSCLQLLDQEIASRATLTQADLAWTGNFVLTPSEVDFGYGLSVDFLVDPRVDWLGYVTRYLNAMMPALKQPFCIGFIGWMQGEFKESLARYMALGLVFEAIYRITVHLLGHSVLQLSRPNATNQLKFQYRMLDERSFGLCTDDVLNHIVEPVDPVDRPTAKDTLRLAMKARNAFSHGAITTLDRRTADGVGHLIVKSVQTLVAGGLQHMVREAAYYEWENAHSLQDGFHEKNWYKGERDVMNMIRRTAEV